MTAAVAGDRGARWVDAVEGFVFAPVGARAATRFRIAVAAAIPIFFWSVGASPDRDLGIDRWFELAFGRWWYSLLVVACGAAHAALARWWTGALLVATTAPLLLASAGQQSRQVVFTAVVASALLHPRSGGRGAGPMWVVRLVQLQLTVLYLVNAVAKATPGYLSGDVLVGLSVMRPNFLVDLSTGELVMAGVAVPVQTLAVATVLVELVLAFALWIPALRWPAAALGVAFHLALTRVVDIHLLGWASVFLYLPFLLDWEDDEAAAATSGGWRGWRCRR